MADYSRELWFLQMPHQSIVDFICVIEAYEGAAVPRVLDKKRGIVELLLAPDQGELVKEVIEDLNQYFPVEIIERPEGVKSISDSDC